MATFIVVITIVFGRLRQEPWWAIAATAIGANAFLTGIRWASTLGDEAIWAAGLATGGFALWTEVAAWLRGRSPSARARTAS